MKTIFSIVLFLIILTSIQQSSGQIKPVNLKTEYLENPIGIDTKFPRFSWQLSAEEDGILQRAFLIMVGTDSLSVKNNHGDSWDSGKTSSTTIPVT